MKAYKWDHGDMSWLKVENGVRYGALICLTHEVAVKQLLGFIYRACCDSTAALEAAMLQGAAICARSPGPIKVGAIPRPWPSLSCFHPFISLLASSTRGLGSSFLRFTMLSLLITKVPGPPCSCKTLLALHLSSQKHNYCSKKTRFISVYITITSITNLPPRPSRNRTQGESTNYQYLFQKPKCTVFSTSPYPLLLSWPNPSPHRWFNIYLPPQVWHARAPPLLMC